MMQLLKTSYQPASASPLDSSPPKLTSADLCGASALQPLTLNCLMASSVKETYSQSGLPVPSLTAAILPDGTMAILPHNQISQPVIPLLTTPEKAGCLLQMSVDHQSIDTLPNSSLSAADDEFCVGKVRPISDRLLSSAVVNNCQPSQGQGLS